MSRPTTQSFSILVLLLFSLAAFLKGCVPVALTSSSSPEGTSKQLQLADFAYEPTIKTILLYPAFGSRQNELLPPVVPMGQFNLLLEFDDLWGQVENYYVRIIHCNHNWTKSDLLDLDFMYEYNEFPINQYEIANDTQIPYVHYTFGVPPVKIPGNYVLVVYRGSDKNDVALTKRFMVYENRVTFERTGSLIGPGQVASMNQQINFTINYKNVEIMNPMQDVFVVIRQNQRWDNLADQIKPSFIRENTREIEYRFFDADKLFKGGNEFRFFDLRSVMYPGQNVASVDKTTKPLTAHIARDRSREGEVYSQYNDRNGNFFIDELDFRNLLTANYLNVNFTLQTPEVNGEVYVTGAFNYWNLDNINKMTYHSDTKAYHGEVLLKQGYYDYQYIIRSSSLDPLHFEGSHFQTENMYEIFVYYRPYQPRADVLIGYLRLDENERR